MFRHDTRVVLDDVYLERSEQLAKWGEQRHVPLRWLGILSEEVGEVAKEILTSAESGNPLNHVAYRAELIQVAAVAVAAVEALDAQGRGA